MVTQDPKELLLFYQIQLRQIYESSREVFLVLELADGGDLFERIVKKGHYSEKEAARVMYQVLCALEVKYYMILGLN